VLDTAKRVRRKTCPLFICVFVNIVRFEVHDRAVFEAVTPDELGRGDETPGIERKVAFKTENNIVVQAHVTGGTESGWHHHGERHVYGYLLEGAAAF
jgi:hypothetical protein